MAKLKNVTAKEEQDGPFTVTISAIFTPRRFTDALKVLCGARWEFTGKLTFPAGHKAVMDQMPHHFTSIRELP